MLNIKLQLLEVQLFTFKKGGFILYNSKPWVLYTGLIISVVSLLLYVNFNSPIIRWIGNVGVAIGLLGVVIYAVSYYKSKKNHLQNSNSEE